MNSHPNAYPLGKLLRTAVCLLSCLFASHVHATIKPHQIFTAGGVLQRDQVVKLSGTGDVGETITASINDSTSSSKIDRDGKWELQLPAMPAGGPYQLELSTHDDHIALNDILIGDVWLCSGQSNMGWTMAKSKNAAQEIAQANNPKIRLFHVGRAASETPLEDVQGRWLPANKYSVKNFSAVAWHFGNSLQPEIDVPVGLILAEVGGTLANNWTSESTLDKHPNIQKYRDRFTKLKSEYPALLADWETKRRIDSKAKKPTEPARRQPSGYFNAMIAPLQPISLKGVIWYQGESDSWQWPDYTQFFQDLIADWRDGFEAPELPFLYVMLAGFNGKPRVDENYPHIRDIQLKTLQLPHTAMASALDVGEEDDIHPGDKKTVGERLALAARGTVYGEAICFSGPIMKTVELLGDTAVVHYDHVCDGLIAPEAPLTAFEVAGEDGAFVPASAKIVDDTVVVKSDAVPQIKFVRYAWGGFPNSNLYNKAHLPATPFRTDPINSLPN